MLMTIEEKRDSIKRVFHVDDELDTLIAMCKAEGETRGETRGIKLGLMKAKEIVNSVCQDYSRDTGDSDYDTYSYGFKGAKDLIYKSIDNAIGGGK